MRFAVPGWTGSILAAPLSWQGLQPQSSLQPSAELTPFFGSHFSSVRCKTGHNGFTNTTQESCGLTHADSVGLTCMFTEGALHPSVQVAEEDV